MGATHTATCKWCNRKYEKGNNALIFIKLGSDFCSKKCETAYSVAHGESNLNSGALSKEQEKQLKLENERQELELRKIKDQELAEKKAKRHTKAEVLKGQDKPFMAFVVVNQDRITTGAIFALVMGLPLAFAIGGKVIGIVYGVVIGGALVFGMYKYLKEMFRK